MKKRYLEPGESIRLNFYGRVGPSGTLVDVQADLTEMVASCGNNPSARIGQSIGTIVRNENTSDVFVEIETGRLWHNEDDGWY